MDIIESFSPKGPTAGTAYEAGSMIEISHCLAGFGRPCNFFATSVTDTYCFETIRTLLLVSEIFAKQKKKI